MYQDDSLPHQIRIFLVAGGPGLGVSCNCMRLDQKQGGYEPIEVRNRWEAHEAQTVYRAHLAEPEAAAS
jgi:hypothetical protein